MPAGHRRQRPAGWLRTTIASVLETTGTPLSACELAKKIKADHGFVHLSAVFRALARMLKDGEVDRIELVAGYVRRRPVGTITLLCRQCGGCIVAPNDELWRRIEQGASASGFTPNRYVLEALGHCAECRRIQQAP